MSQPQSFVQTLDADALKFFKMIAAKSFRDQAISVLNAYWKEIGDQAEFIYSVIHKIMVEADMHAKNISLIHLYEEGSDLELNIAFYFYEKFCKFVENSKEFGDEKYKKSHPVMLTAITRRNELREKVDVTITQRISMLEVLLHQYRDNSEINPKNFVNRSMSSDIHPEIKKAMETLDEVNKKIKIYEKKKAMLVEKSKLDGIKGNQGKHELAIFEQGPEKEDLNVALLKSEAALRRVKKQFGDFSPCESDGKKIDDGNNQQSMGGGNKGSIFWMERDLKEKREKYGKKN